MTRRSDPSPAVGADPDPNAGRRTALGCAGAMLVALVAAGVAASGPPDRLAAQAAGFDQAYATYQGWFTGERDELGTSYMHWRYNTTADPTGGTRRIDAETDYARMGRGRDIALLRRDRNSRPGFSLDYLHEPGSDEDLVLIGDRYREPVELQPGEAPAPLATTLWISRPTTLADSSGWDPCATAGTSGFCALELAIATTRAAVPGVPRTYQRAADGTVTTRTAIRFIDLVTYDIAPTNARQLAVLQPVFDTLVPFTITFRPDGNLDRAELNGRLSTPDASIEVQLGLEHRGVATLADFPAPPTDPVQIARVSRLEWVFFIDAAKKLQNQEQAAEAAPAPPR